MDCTRRCAIRLVYSRARKRDDHCYSANQRCCRDKQNNINEQDRRAAYIIDVDYQSSVTVKMGNQHVP